MKMRMSLVRASTPILAVTLLLALTSCGAKVSEKDLAACQSAWDSISTALSSAPKATYNDSAPDPTFDEKMDYFMVLVDSQSEIRDLSSTLELGELQLALMKLNLGIGAMSLDFLENPRGRGTPGITKFNDAFKAVTELCKKSGWEN
jgi:hypothetical protein